MTARTRPDEGPTIAVRAHIARHRYAGWDDAGVDPDDWARRLSAEGLTAAEIHAGSIAMLEECGRVPRDKQFATLRRLALRARLEARAACGPRLLAAAAPRVPAGPVSGVSLGPAQAARLLSRDCPECGATGFARRRYEVMRPDIGTSYTVVCYACRCPSGRWLTIHDPDLPDLPAAPGEVPASIDVGGETWRVLRRVPDDPARYPCPGFGRRRPR